MYYAVIIWSQLIFPFLSTTILSFSLSFPPAIRTWIPMKGIWSKIFQALHFFTTLSLVLAYWIPVYYVFLESPFLPDNFFSESENCWEKTIVLRWYFPALKANIFSLQLMVVPLFWKSLFFYAENSDELENSHWIAEISFT